MCKCQNSEISLWHDKISSSSKKGFYFLFVPPNWVINEFRSRVDGLFRLFNEVKENIRAV